MGSSSSKEWTFISIFFILIWVWLINKIIDLDIDCVYMFIDFVWTCIYREMNPRRMHSPRCRRISNSPEDEKMKSMKPLSSGKQAMQFPSVPHTSYRVISSGLNDEDDIPL